jgi:hypothetical protein
MAIWHQIVYYGPIVVGLVVGAFGAYQGIKEKQPEVAGIASAVSGVLASFSAKFTKESELGLAQLHFGRANGFDEIRQTYESLAHGHKEPSAAAIERLEQRWTEVNSPPSA